MKTGACSSLVVKAADGATLVSSAECAGRLPGRCKGLLGRDALETGRGLLLVPCRAVHTFFMRFSLDLVFFSRDFHVVRTVGNVGPWRVVHGGRGAWGVLEVQAGWLPWERVREGDLLVLDGKGSDALS